MSENIPQSIPTSSTHRPHKKARLSPTSAQGAQLEALFANPDRDIKIPSGPTAAVAQAPPEIVANVQGSSAGAGSGEFHVYKASRRREYERLRIMDEEVEREERDREWEQKRAKAREEEEEKVRKNREKREKAKARKSKKGKGGGAGMDVDGEEPPKKKRIMKKKDIPFVWGATSVEPTVLEQYKQAEAEMFAADKLVMDTEVGPIFPSFPLRITNRYLIY